MMTRQSLGCKNRLSWGGGERCENMLHQLAQIKMDLNYSAYKIGAGSKILKQLHKMFLNLATFFCTPRFAKSVQNRKSIASRLSDLKKAFELKDLTRYNSARLELELTILGVSNPTTKRHGRELRTLPEDAQNHYVEETIRSWKNINEMYWPKKPSQLAKSIQTYHMSSLPVLRSSPTSRLQSPPLAISPEDRAEEMIGRHLRSVQN